MALSRTAFRKSTRSNANGTCLEAMFKPSSYSKHGSACIEAARPADAVLVRDSKDVTITGLAFTPAAWTAFLTTVKA